MIFGTYLLYIEDNPDLTINTFKKIISSGASTFQPEGSNFLFEINHEIIDNRFYWLSCDYDNAKKFKDYVINTSTGEKEDNPRNVNQVETRQQVFVCFDCSDNRLYLSDKSRKSFVSKYFADALQKEVQIKTIISSADSFYNQISTLHQLRFTQVDNLFSRGTTIFNDVPNFYGLDLPNKMKIAFTYDGHAVTEGFKGFVDYVLNNRDSFKDVILIGHDDTGLEKVFDLSNVYSKISFKINKDEFDRYSSVEVRSKLLDQLR